MNHWRVPVLHLNFEELLLGFGFSLLVSITELPFSPPEVVNQIGARSEHPLLDEELSGFPLRFSQLGPPI
jgi:hypothetical protein